MKIAAAIFLVGLVAASPGSVLTGTEGQVVALLLCGAAAIRIAVSAWAGLPAHRSPRVMLAVVMVMMTGTYAADITGWWDASTVAAWRRGFGYALFVSLYWTASTGHRFWKQESAALGKFKQEIERTRCGE